MAVSIVIVEERYSLLRHYNRYMRVRWFLYIMAPQVNYFTIQIEHDHF